MKRRDFLVTTLGLAVLPIVLPKSDKLPIPTLSEIFGVKVCSKEEAKFIERVRRFDSLSTEEQKQYANFFLGLSMFGDSELISAAKDLTSRLGNFYQSRIKTIY